MLCIIRERDNLPAKDAHKSGNDPTGHAKYRRADHAISRSADLHREQSPLQNPQIMQCASSTVP
jgi:hypothetical protein